MKFTNQVNHVIIRLYHCPSLIELIFMIKKTKNLAITSFGWVGYQVDSQVRQSLIRSGFGSGQCKI